ncbi:hypothetical protein BGZ54_000170 [Gamsiella multidivaricata]|nr:hypothetical protein BGZ54_000170 [Gamsiella multidivaricata]
MDFWKAVRDSRSLDSLHFSYAIVGLELADIFWQTCTRLEFLCIAFAEVPDIPSFATHSFSRIQHLVLSWVRGGLSPERQLELMVQCPQLQRLTWRGMHDQLPLNALCDKAAQGVWPKLEELNLEDTQIRDEDLSVLLTSINRLTVLQANSTGFALLSFEALSKHFSTLVYLDIENCPKASSPMVHAIMVSCPSLIKMRAPMICGTDVIQGDGKSELGQPWVCAKLKELSLCLDLGGLDSQMDILQRLGDLKQLENLNISTRKQLSGEYSGRSLQFSLEKGIDSLRTLRRLSVFEFDGVDQDMGESEILWVMEHWKNLQIIRGRLNRDLMRHYELMAILKTRQIDLED